jgi:hypothetical protein
VNIADISSSVSLYLETGKFEADAAKEGEKAGATMGAAMSAKVQTSLSKVAAAGAGLELGKQMLHGLESAFSAVANILPNMIQSGEAFGQNVEDITKKTGASAETASRFVATLTYLGQSTEGLGMSLKTLSVQITSNEAQFTKLGIATRDSGGNLLDTITILNNVRSYLSTAGDGATKLALATHLLGKSAGNLIEYLNLTNAQAAALNDTFDALGVTMSEKAVRDIEGATRESRLLGIAWQGVSNVLTTEVVPTIRQVLGAAFSFIVQHGAEVRQTLVDITNAALGLITGVLGIEGVTPFQAQLDALGGSSTNATLSFDQWAQQMGYTVPVIDKTAGAAKAASAAISAESKSIDKQVTALKLLDTQQAKTYTDGLTQLNAQLDAQGKLMDAQDQAVQRADTAANLQRSLRDATEALAKAQLDAQTALAAAAGDTKLSPQAKAQAQIDAATSIRNAEEALSQARQAIADNARTMTEQDRKAQIQSVKDELTAIDKIVSDAGLAGGSSKTALADLEKRRKALTVGGAPAAGSDSAIQLTAVLAAETRIRQQALSTTKQDALAAKKDQLSQEAAAQTSADSAKVVADKKTLAELQKQYKTYLTQQTIATNKTVVAFEALFKGDPKAGTGLGGAISKAFADGQTAGETFRSWIDDSLLPTISKIASAMSGIKIDGGALTMVGLGLVAAGTASLNPVWIAGGLALVTAGGAIGATGDNANQKLVPGPGTLPGWNGNPVNPTRDSKGNYIGPVITSPGRAAGGYIPPLTWAMTGERGPEPVFGGRTGVTVLPNSSLGGGTLVVEHLSLDLGGDRVIDLIDQKLAYRRRR